jgi:Mn-dependent DtxR family transcriptional regulator
MAQKLARRLQSQETPRSEDYLEAVYHLIHDKGYATTVDISDRLQVKPPTVSSMIGKLASKGYLVHEPYRGMKLTPMGEKAARSVIRRHEIISEFLSMLGVDSDVAYEDTEGIEHHLQPITIYKIEMLVEYFGKNPRQLTQIREYLEKE